MKAGVKILIQFITTLFFAGSALLLFFILLAGIKKDGNVLNKWYFLAADTSNFEGAKYPVSRWSMYGICGYQKGDSIKHPGDFIECTPHKADFPFDPKRNFHVSEDRLWSEFQTNKFYYETRFQFPFYLIALFFDVLALFMSVFAGLKRWMAISISAFSFLTFIFVAIAASLSTAAYVQARNVFHHHSTDAAIGPALYGFAWAVVFMSFVNIILPCVLAVGQKSTRSASSGKSFFKKNRNQSSANQPGGYRYRFGLGKKKTTEVKADTQDKSSFVRA